MIKKRYGFVDSFIVIKKSPFAFFLKSPCLEILFFVTLTITGSKCKRLTTFFLIFLELILKSFPLKAYGVVEDTGIILPLKYFCPCKEKSNIKSAISFADIGALRPGKASSNISV